MIQSYNLMPITLYGTNNCDTMNKPRATIAWE